MKAALRAQQARFEQKRNLLPVNTGRHAVWHFWSFLKLFKRHRSFSDTDYRLIFYPKLTFSFSVT